MVLRDQYSSIVAIVYFSVNFVFLIGLGIIVYRQGGHSVKSKSYFKDLWNQRKIYAPLIIHFYDTATDIGVIYNWYQLMQKEQNGVKDYTSVDMTVFFWSGIAFLAVYRVCLFCYVVWEAFIDGDGEWYYVLLVLCDLYIFVAVYESFNAAKGIITANAAKRAENAEKRAKARREKNMEKAATEQDVRKTMDAIQHELEPEQDVEPAEKQMFVQLGEAITESMPQIVLQSVFIIRSANADDEDLNSGSNVYLLMLSIIASLFSISSKFVTLDKDKVYDYGKSLKPRARFPGCVQYWYIIRVTWRLCHIMSRFCSFVLIWTLMGGAWLPIWGSIVWIYWSIMGVRVENIDEIPMSILFGLVFTIGSTIERSENNYIYLMCRTIESVIGLTLITLFGTLSFHCGICSDPVTRQIFNNQNYRILIFWILGVSAAVFDCLLLLTLLRRNIFE
eukprot:788538_1